MPALEERRKLSQSQQKYRLKLRRKPGLMKPLVGRRTSSSDSSSSGSSSSSAAVSSEISEIEILRLKKLYSPKVRKNARRPRKLTDRRWERVKLFLEDAHTHPGKYGKIGSDTWISALIESLKETRRNGVVSSDVKHWLTEHSEEFCKCIKQIRYLYRNQDFEAASRSLPRRDNPSASSSSSETSLIKFGARASMNSNRKNSSLQDLKKDSSPVMMNGAVGSEKQDGISSDLRNHSQEPDASASVGNSDGQLVPTGNNSLVVQSTALVQNECALGADIMLQFPNELVPLEAVIGNLPFPWIRPTLEGGTFMIAGTFQLDSLRKEVEKLEGSISAFKTTSPTQTVNSDSTSSSRSMSPKNVLQVYESVPAKDSIALNMNWTWETFQGIAQTIANTVAQFNDVGPPETISRDACFYAMKTLEACLNAK